MQLAPMIDIVFLLLIFFIVTWQFSRSETELNVSVPTAEEGSELNRPKGEIIINILADGMIKIDMHFLSDVFMPFPLAGWRLGAVEAARILFPQAFGVAALILAFLAHQYSQLVQDRRRMRSELELTI